MIVSCGRHCIYTCGLILDARYWILDDDLISSIQHPVPSIQNLTDKRRIPIAVESVFTAYGLLIGLENILSSGKGRYQH